MKLSGATPASILQAGATAIGLPELVPVIEVASQFIDKAKQWLDAIGLNEQRIAEIFGASRPRFSREELTIHFKNIYNELLGRDPEPEVFQVRNAYFENILFGYMTLDDLVNGIKASGEYKRLQEIKELIPIIKQNFINIIGREPYDREINDWTVGIIFKKEATVQNMIDSLYLSPEYKTRSMAGKTALSYIIGVGIVLSIL